MTAAYERISNRARGTGYAISLPEAGDRFTVRFLAPYGSIIQWHRNAVSWSGSGVLVEANNGTEEDLQDEAAWVARPVAVSGTEPRPITAMRFTATAPAATVTVWSTVDLDESGFATDSAP